MTRRRNNSQRSGGITAHPAPKTSDCKNPLEKFSPPFFLGSRRHPPYWLSSKRPNYQRRVLLISAGGIEGHFEGKTLREVHQGGLVLVRQCPAYRALATQNWLTWASSVLITQPTLLIWPRLTTTCSLDRKKQLKGLHFSSDADVIAAAETWLDGQTSIFFEWLAKVRLTL